MLLLRPKRPVRIKRNNNAVAKIEDFKPSRYICYLIVQNAAPNKEVVTIAQTYFAVQTRKQEIIKKRIFFNEKILY